MLQQERVMQYLFENVNKEVWAWDLVMNTRVLHYTEVIRLLRKKWNKIENRTCFHTNRFWERVKHSYYKLVIEWPKEKKTLKDKIFNFFKNL